MLSTACIFLLAGFAYAYDVHSLRSSNPDSHNVVNIYFGDNHDESSRDHSELNELSASSCSELKQKHGIATTGFYWMKSHFPSNGGTFVYCDFHVYTGVSTCAELTARYNVSEYGYYRLGNPRTKFQYCPEVHTCHHLVQRDHISESGFYQIGIPGDEYSVYCNLFSSTAITEIWHDSTVEQAVTSCQNAACYSHRPQYLLAMDKILKVMQHSDRCQQFIKYRCQGSVLLYYPNTPYGYWLSRDGEKMNYWGGGSSKRTGYCACGETGSCLNKQKRCNCDVNNGTMTGDEGFLTDKAKLPVSEMRFGDTDDSGEHGWHTLGKLECMG